jgi:hypothetical protein
VVERSFAWSILPRVGVSLPSKASRDWSGAATWCALLAAWGIPFEAFPPENPSGAYTTRLTPDLLPDVPALGEAEKVADAAFATLEQKAAGGLVGIWRWPNAKACALVVDGDVDHPTGVDPECARYVTPAIETARRAGYPAYGVFVAAANVDAEPTSFPLDGHYYNHSFSHPFSHWNPNPWKSLDEAEMTKEIKRSDATFRGRLGATDRRMFRLPHFQWEAWDRTASVLERLGYLAESSVGANHSITGGLPYQPAIERWSDRPEDAALLRTHPHPAGRRTFLQLPISTDPVDPSFPNGCCSYNTLGEGVRTRTADPGDYERVLQDVLDRSVERRSLAHLFIDPPDAGYGRLSGDTRDYAGAVERWLGRAMARPDLAVMTTAELASWWLARDAAVSRLRLRCVDGRLFAGLDGAPPGTTIALFRPDAGWTYEVIEEDSG